MNLFGQFLLGKNQFQQSHFRWSHHYCDYCSWLNRWIVTNKQKTIRQQAYVVIHNIKYCWCGIFSFVLSIRHPVRHTAQTIRWLQRLDTDREYSYKTASKCYIFMRMTSKLLSLSHGCSFKKKKKHSRWTHTQKQKPIKLFGVKQQEMCILRLLYAL